MKVFFKVQFTPPAGRRRQLLSHYAEMAYTPRPTLQCKDVQWFNFIGAVLAPPLWRGQWGTEFSDEGPVTGKNFVGRMFKYEVLDIKPTYNYRCPLTLTFTFTKFYWGQWVAGSWLGAKPALTHPPLELPQRIPFDGLLSFASVVVRYLRMRTNFCRYRW